MASAAQDEFNALSANSNDKHISHPEDSRRPSDTSASQSGSELSNTSDGEEKSTTHSSPNMPSAVYHIPQGTSFDANTGPKGVIADAKSFDRARKRSFRKTLYALSNGLTGNVFGDKHQVPRSAREKSSSPENSADEDEDQFMRTWRQKRMNELQSQGHDHRTRRLSPSKRRYGHMVHVDPMGYLDAIEKVGAETIVVVMISDDDSPISGIVEDSLKTLSRKYEFTRFVKISNEEAEIDPAATPAILAYKAGDLFANLVSIIDYIPDGRDVSASSLETVLRQYKVLF